MKKGIMILLSLLVTIYLITFVFTDLWLKIIAFLGWLLIVVSTYLIANVIKKCELIKIGKKIVGHLDDALIITDKNNLIIFANESFLSMVGYQIDEIKGKNPSMFKGGLYQKDFYQLMWQEILAKGMWEGELIDKRKDGSFFIKKLSIGVIYKYKKVKYHYSIQKDIDYIRKLEKDKNRYLYRNTETLLPNEQFFIEKTNELLNENSIIVYCKVLNRLLIESKMGRDIYLKGLLRLFGGIKNTIKNDGLLAEFDRETLVMLVDSSKISIELLINKILSHAQNIIIDELSLSLDIRMGIATKSDKENLTTKELLSDAFIALSEAMEKNDILFSIYRDSMKVEVNKEFDRQIALKKDIQDNKLAIYYQPQINSKTNEVIGVEALLRWFSDDLGYVPPIEFLPIAEKYGYMSKIDSFIMNTIMQDFTLLKTICPNIKISINVNQNEFINGDFLKRLIKKAERYHFPLNQLIIELNEGQVIKNSLKLAELVKKAKTFGIEISLDDFGTGYNSLRSLTLIPVDEIKIDKSFIDKFPTETYEIVNSIIVLANNSKKRIIVEGVETNKQKEELNKLGGYNIQGYLYAKPMAIKDLMEWIKVR